MSDSKKKFPEVRIPVFVIDRLLHLTEAQLKVWLYYKRRMGANNKAWGKASAIGEATELVKGTVKNARSWLVKHGWLKPNGFTERGLPMFLAVIGELPPSFSNDWEGNPQIIPPVISELPGGSFSNDTEVVTLEGATDEGATDEEEVSQLVSESVQADCPTPSKEGTEEPQSDGDRKTKLEPLTSELWETLFPDTQKVIRHLYPAAVPLYKVADWRKLNGTVTFWKYIGEGTDWDAFFSWHRAHKPGALQFRSPEKLLEGVEYAMNDFASHDPVTCARCKKLGAAQ